MPETKSLPSPVSQFVWLIILLAFAAAGVAVFFAAPVPQRPAAAHFLAAQLGALMGYCLVASVIAGIAKLALKSLWQWFHWLNAISLIGTVIFLYRLFVAPPDAATMTAVAARASALPSIVGVWQCKATASGLHRVVTYRGDGTMMSVNPDGSAIVGWAATNWTISDSTLETYSADKETFTKSRIAHLDLSRLVTVSANDSQISCTR